MKTKIIHLAILLAISVVGYAQMEANQFNVTTLTADTPAAITKEQRDATPDYLKTHPEYGILPHKAPCTDCYELLEERKDSSRMFVKLGTEGKEFYSQAVYGLFHYEKDGYKISYDPRLKRKTNTLFTAEQQDNPTFLSITERQSGFVTQEGSFTFNNKIDLLFHRQDGVIINKGSANWSNYTVGDEGIYITNAWENIDIQIIYQLDRIKLNYVITAPLQGLNDVTNIQFIDHHQLPNGYSIRPQNPQDVHNGIYSGKLLIYDQNELVNFEIDNAFGFDNSGNKENGMKFNYQFSSDYLKLNVPSSWLNNPSMQYPIQIDPTVTATATQTGGWMSFKYNGEFCGSTGHCSYLLNVPTPPNTTITQVTTNNQYISSGGYCFFNCYMNEAGFKISGPCGISPADANFFWYCNSASSGTCNGSNNDITNTAICVTPSCTGLIPFYMRTSYCYCNINGNCGDNCQYMPNNTWSITIIGRTLEVPGTISLNPTPCTGSINLATAPNFGVPNYTYLWNTGATTANINVTNAGTYTVDVRDNCNITTRQTFVIACPLGINLVHFSAVKTGREVLLSWETLYEKNNDYFTIEKRSESSKDWEIIGNVKGLETSEDHNYYTLIDSNLDFNYPNVYYRLTQTDKDGTAFTFNPVLINIGIEEDILVFPQPASNELNVTWKGFNGNLKLFTLLGAKVDINYLKQNEVYRLDTSELSKGVYLLTFEINQQTIQTKRILID